MTNGGSRRGRGAPPGVTPAGLAPDWGAGAGLATLVMPAPPRVPPLLGRRFDATCAARSRSYSRRVACVTRATARRATQEPERLVAEPQGAEEMSRPGTLGELRETGWVSRPVKQEIRENAVTRIANGEPVVEGVVGYE